MADGIGSIGTSWLEWLAVRATFITASAATALADPEENFRFVSMGMRLSANLTEEIGGHWLVADASLDDDRLPPHLNLVNQEHWLLLRPGYQDVSRNLLTIDTLIGSRWSFGLSNREPLTHNFFFRPDGKIGGYQHLNEQSWEMKGGSVLVLNAAGEVTWKFDLALLEDDHLKIIGFAQQEWAECAYLVEMPAVDDAVRQHEFVAISATFISATAADPQDAFETNNKFAPIGARLVANLQDELLGHWVIADGAVDGELLAPHLCLLGREHWVMLPPRDDEAARDLLTEERLTGSRWSFGLSNREPICNAFYFLKDGKIGGYKHFNEQFWKLQGRALQILSADGLVTWKFEIALLEGELLKVVGFAQQNWLECAVLMELLPLAGSALNAPRASGTDSPTDDFEIPDAMKLENDDQIKMIIWDLDDTFWSGTLAEGGFSRITANEDFIKQISARGIINSICSKNDFAATKAALVEIGMWDYFVFPRIAFTPKGEMIGDIIQTAQLRSASVLFVDDNIMNIEEALHYNPGLQVCAPEAITALLHDRRCAGKPDPDMQRLAWYKVLEQKTLDRAAISSDNLEFLKQSEIRISFHHDVLDEFSRVHSLVNRTNQLNFTKNRWPEDEYEARELFERELHEKFNSHAGYVKVADKYGTYGICGFYLVREDECQHFLFSCRSMNMGVEQFVWQRIGRPHCEVVGEVVSSLGDAPDWIEVVEDADVATPKAASAGKTSVCIRGACDLAMMTSYLRMHFDTAEEFTFPFMGWGIHPVARAIALYDEVNTPAGKEFLAKMPGMPPRRFDSDVITGASDVYILSFSSEVFTGLYRSKSTGMILPLDCWAAPRLDFSKLSFAEIQNRAREAGVREADWTFLQNEFEFCGVTDVVLLQEDVKKIFARLADKIVIVLMLNATVGNNKWLLGEFRNINSVVRPLTKAFGFHAIEMSAFVRSESDLIEPTDGGAHFKREVYQRLAKEVSDIVEAHHAARMPALEEWGSAEAV